MTYGFIAEKFTDDVRIALANAGVGMQYHEEANMLDVHAPYDHRVIKEQGEPYYYLMNGILFYKGDDEVARLIAPGDRDDVLNRLELKHRAADSRFLPV